MSIGRVYSAPVILVIRVSTVLAMCFFFLFFKQKTAYEMRISDWSSDVCSSDLRADHRLARLGTGAAGRPPSGSRLVDAQCLSPHERRRQGRADERLPAAEPVSGRI